VGAAALVLLRALLTVLVRPDGDVLGAVVGGHFAGPQGDDRRREREQRRRQLAAGRGQPARATKQARSRGRGNRTGEDAWPLERQLRLGERALHLG
jgi:hypothetical protein